MCGLMFPFKIFWSCNSVMGCQLQHLHQKNKRRFQVENTKVISAAENHFNTRPTHFQIGNSEEKSGPNHVQIKRSADVQLPPQ